MQNEELQRVQREARSFIGRKGLVYVETKATQRERNYFKGVLYNKDGSPLTAKISKLSEAI